MLRKPIVYAMKTYGLCFAFELVVFCGCFEHFSIMETFLMFFICNIVREPT